MSYFANVGLKDGPWLDAFGRLRVSNPATRFDVEFSNDAQPLLMDQITAGGATIAHNSTTRDVALSIVGTGGTAAATFGSNYHVPYTPGCGQLIDITGTLDYGGIGGGTAAIFIRNNGSDTVTNQASWLYASNAASIDWKYSQILAIDFQSLKVGRLRIGFVRNGAFVPVHEIYNDNVRANGYWQRPNLPVAWKIYNSGGNTIAEMGYFDANNGIGLRYTLAANAGAKLLAICATVKSDGGRELEDIDGIPWSAGNGVTTKSVSNTLIPVCSLQVQTTYNSLPNRSLVIPTGIGFYLDNPAYYQVIINPTLTGASFASINANCSTYLDTSATVVTGGRVIDSDYLASTKTGDVSASLTGRIPLSINYAGTTGDILTVAAVRATGANLNMAVSLKFKEIR